jgi:hypothetical protein
MPHEAFAMTGEMNAIVFVLAVLGTIVILVFAGSGLIWLLDRHVPPPSKPR